MDFALSTDLVDSTALQARVFGHCGDLRTLHSCTNGSLTFGRPLFDEEGRCMARHLADPPEQSLRNRKRSFWLNAPDFTTVAGDSSIPNKRVELGWTPPEALEATPRVSATPDRPQQAPAAPSQFARYLAVRSLWPAAGLLQLAWQQSLHSHPLQERPSRVCKNDALPSYSRGSISPTGSLPGLILPSSE